MSVAMLDIIVNLKKEIEDLKNSKMLSDSMVDCYQEMCEKYARVIKDVTNRLGSAKEHYAKIEEENEELKVHLQEQNEAVQEWRNKCDRMVTEYLRMTSEFHRILRENQDLKDKKSEEKVYVKADLEAVLKKLNQYMVLPHDLNPLYNRTNIANERLMCELDKEIKAIIKERLS